MESNRLSEHAQSLLGGVKRENPMGKGKLGNEKTELIIKLNYIKLKLIRLGVVIINLLF